MSDILQEELEMRLMDTHFEFKTRTDWIPHSHDRLRKGIMVKEAKDQLVKAIEEYFRVCYFSIHDRTFSEDDEPIYHLGYYAALIENYERNNPDMKFPKE